MGDGGTGVAPDTDRCPSCGHPAARKCGCWCCGRLARCRHCGRSIVSYQDWWMDINGMYACAKGPVLHQPMPDGMRGAVLISGV